MWQRWNPHVLLRGMFNSIVTMENSLSVPQKAGQSYPMTLQFYSWYHFMGNRWGNSGNSVRLYFFWLQHHSIIKRAIEFQKNIYFCLLTMPKPLTVWITINCGKFRKRWEYQTT